MQEINSVMRNVTKEVTHWERQREQGQKGWSERRKHTGKVEIIVVGGGEEE